MVLLFFLEWLILTWGISLLSLSWRSDSAFYSSIALLYYDSPTNREAVSGAAGLYKS